MKKVFNFLRSMRFGIILLVLIAACSIVGTVIPQGREIAWYAQTYRSFHGCILLLRLNRVFESWYFIALLVLLCLNLSLCSILRIRTVVKAAKGDTERAAKTPDTVHLTPEGTEKLREYLTDMHCRAESVGEATVWRRHSFGRYGTFITHLSILLTVIFGALALYTPTVTDRDCMPGESVFMDDGTEIHVHDFRMADDTGRLDYRSHVQITLPNGRRSEIAELKVNHPFSFGPWKLFQQTFGTAGSVTVTDLKTAAATISCSPNSPTSPPTARAASFTIRSTPISSATPAARSRSSPSPRAAIPTPSIRRRPSPTGSSPPCWRSREMSSR